MGWGAAKQAAGSGGGRYVKPEDGVTHKMVFTGEPYVIYKRWDGTKMHIEEGPGNGIDAKFLLEFVDLNAPSGVQQFECSAACFRAIGAELPSDPADIAKTSVIFKRVGTGKKTKYNVVAGGKLSADELEVVRLAVQDQTWSLDDVEGAMAFEDEDGPSTPTPSNDTPDDDVPF